MLQVALILQASWGRSGKQQQEQTSPNHVEVLFSGPVLQSALPLVRGHVANFALGPSKGGGSGGLLPFRLNQLTPPPLESLPPPSSVLHGRGLGSAGRSV